LIRPPIRALVVDFGGVLTTPLHNAMEAFSAGVGIELQDLVRISLRAYTGHPDPLVVDFETGRILEDEFEVEFAARITEETGVDIEAAGLVARLFAGLELEEEMLRAVERARGSGLMTALLSNSWGTTLYPRTRLDGLFDVMIISGEVGLRKPDPEIFRLVLDRLGVEPATAVFVDDHPGHLKAAAGLGLRTVLHRSPAETLDELEDLLDLALR